MKIREVLKYNRIIKNIIDSDMDVSPLVKFKLLGMLKQFSPVLDDFESVRNEMIQKYGSPSPNGGFGIFSPNPDDFENGEDYKKAAEEYEGIIGKFNNELDKIADSEANFEVQKFNYADIMNAGIPADYLLDLYELIEE